MWVLAEGIAGREHGVRADVPDDQCEDSVDPLHDIGTELHVGTQDELGRLAVRVDARNPGERLAIEDMAVEDCESWFSPRDAGGVRPMITPAPRLPVEAQQKGRGVGADSRRLSATVTVSFPPGG